VAPRSLLLQLLAAAVVCKWSAAVVERSVEMLTYDV